MESVIHLLLTLRRDVWRVRILIPGEPVPLWKSYREAEYPTPEAVVRRCMEGLVGRGKDDEHDKSHNNSYQNATHCGMPLYVRWEFQPRLCE